MKYNYQINLDFRNLNHRKLFNSKKKIAKPKDKVKNEING